MGTDARAIENLRDLGIDFFEEFSLEEKPPAETSLSRQGWHVFMRAGVAFIFKRDKTIKTYEKFIRASLKTHWISKWSEAYILNTAKNALAYSYIAYKASTNDENNVDARPPAKDAALKPFEEMAQKLDIDPPEKRVYFPIYGVHLANEAMQIGPFRIFTMNDAEKEIILSRVRSILETTPHSPEERNLLLKRQKDHLDLLGSSTLVEMAACGDNDNVEAIAREKLEILLDYLQLIATLQGSARENFRIGSGIAARVSHAPHIIINADGSEFQFSFGIDRARSLRLSNVTIEETDKKGFLRLRSLMANDTETNDFNNDLLNSMHWISDAEKQEKIENKITGYITSIELFLSTSQGPISRDVSEFVAFLLEDDREKRKRIRSFMTEMYDARSKASHEGRLISSREAVLELRQIAVDVLAKLCSFPGKFNTKRDLSTWCEDARLSAVTEKFEVGAQSVHWSI